MWNPIKCRVKLEIEAFINISKCYSFFFFIFIFAVELIDENLIIDRNNDTSVNFLGINDCKVN